MSLIHVSTGRRSLANLESLPLHVLTIQLRLPPSAEDREGVRSGSSQGSNRSSWSASCTLPVRWAEAVWECPGRTAVPSATYSFLPTLYVPFPPQGAPRSETYHTRPKVTSPRTSSRRHLCPKSGCSRCSGRVGLHMTLSLGRLPVGLTAVLQCQNCM